MDPDPIPHDAPGSRKGYLPTSTSLNSSLSRLSPSGFMAAKPPSATLANPRTRVQAPPAVSEGTAVTRRLELQ